MKKFLLLLFIALTTSVGAAAQKFALIDMEYIMHNIPAYERAGEQLNQISKKWQAEVEAIDNEAKTLYRNYQNEAVFLSEASDISVQKANCIKSALPCSNPSKMRCTML